MPDSFEPRTAADYFATSLWNTTAVDPWVLPPLPPSPGEVWASRHEARDKVREAREAQDAAMMKQIRNKLETQRGKKRKLTPSKPQHQPVRKLRP
jgi:hypothetical protein